MPGGDSSQAQLGPGGNQDFPIAIAAIPATAAQRRTAIAIIILLVVAAALIGPFANVQLARVDAFVPVLQTVLAIADLLTAVLLFAQYTILPQRAMLAVASAYLCSASFAFLQTLTFPGGYAAAGLMGDGFNTPAWFFVMWHVTFPLGLLVYALLKDVREPAAPDSTTTRSAIGLAVSLVVIVVAALSWVAVAGVASLPVFYDNSVLKQTNLGNQVNVGLLVWYCVVLLVLFSRRRTMLDVWLVVVLVAWVPNFLVAALASSVRFSLGWYASRGFALIASFMLLCVLLTEMTVLYSRLANAFLLVRRERANRLMSLDAATAAIAHELRSPLGAIALNASTASAQLRARPPVLDEMDNILADIEADSRRAGDVIASVRAMFRNTTDDRTVTPVEDCIRYALELAEPELQASRVMVTTNFRNHLVHAHLSSTQLQQVILNLIRNAVDAMAAASPDSRRLHVETRSEEDSTLLVSIQDTGCGVPLEQHDRIFDAFFTTKAAGMGLGLALSRTIMETHGGSLRLAASGPRGSTFELRLPTNSQ